MKATKIITIYSWYSGICHFSSALFNPALFLKGAGNSFQYFLTAYLKDKYYYCLTSNATIMVSHKFPISV